MQWIDPLKDPRWLELTARHPRASVFHTRGWLEALQRTYGYEPVALTTCGADGRFASAMVLCRITSKWTGRRLVSLPFSDHCDLLVEDEREQDRLLDALRHEQERGRWKYAEWRPSHAAFKSPVGTATDDRYCLHRLDLRPSSKELLRSFHQNHVLRKIRRSEREGLTYQEGHSSVLLDAFYKLFVQTRRRHGLPPQPYRWFRNILDCLPGGARVRVAFRDGTAVAGILTLLERDTMVYKYGASAARWHALGGMQFLLWTAIQDACGRGCVTFDLGRSGVESQGLIAFKDHWGATRSPLSYWTYPGRRTESGAVKRSSRAVARRLVAWAPDWLLIRAGTLLYPHIG